MGFNPQRPTRANGTRDFSSSSSVHAPPSKPRKGNTPPGRPSWALSCPTCLNFDDDANPRSRIDACQAPGSTKKRLPPVDCRDRKILSFRPPWSAPPASRNLRQSSGTLRRPLGTFHRDRGAFFGARRALHGEKTLSEPARKAPGRCRSAPQSPRSLPARQRASPKSPRALHHGRGACLGGGRTLRGSPRQASARVEASLQIKVPRA
jgi:hypothetical protein